LESVPAVTARVTILVPVRGRPFHVLRLLWHSNRMKIRQRFLLADGSGDPAFHALLKRSHQIFPNLDIEHVVYDDDGSFRSFYRRTAAAARRVSTPYVMNCGDDDLVLDAGLAPCVAFLDARQDYVSCGGVVAAFSLTADSSGRLPLSGPLTALKYPAGRYYRPRDIHHETALARVTAGYADYLSTYHNVFRSDLLKEIYDEVEQQDFSVLQFREAYQAMRTLASGKVRTDPAVVHFLRQSRVGEAAGGDLIRAAFHPPFAAEFGRMTAQLAGLVSAADGIARETAETAIRDAYAEFFRRKAAGSVKREKRPDVKDARRQGRSPGDAVKAAVREMFDTLAGEGAGNDYLQALRSEFEEIETTLGGGELAAFLPEHASELLAAEEPAVTSIQQVGEVGMVSQILRKLRASALPRDGK
jgi:glycosyltransferase domain-containing protein